MNSMDLDPASDEIDPTLCTVWQQSSSEATHLHLVSPEPQLSPQYGSWQYGMTPQNNPPMNIASNPSFSTPASASNFGGTLYNQPHASGNITQQPFHHHTSQHLGQQTVFTPFTDYAHSYNGGYTAPQHGTTSSIFCTHALHHNFHDSGLGTTPGYNYDGPSNGYSQSASASRQLSNSPAHTQDFSSSINSIGTSASRYFLISSDGQAQQSAQNPQPPPSGGRSSPPFLEVPNPLPNSFKCLTCGETLRTSSEHKKHMARHEKPHKCKYPSCEYASATANDLERHTSSKHMISLHDGRPAKMHSCLLEPCKSHARNFPRLDNFRNHLRKKHNLDEDEVKRFVHRCRRDADDSAPQRPRSQTATGYRGAANYDSTMGHSHNTAGHLTNNIGGRFTVYPLGTVLFPPQQLDVEMPTPGALSPEPATHQAAAYGAWTPRGGQIGGMTGEWGQNTPQMNVPIMSSGFSQPANTPMVSQYSSEIGSTYPAVNFESLRGNAKPADYKLVPDSGPDSLSDLPFRRTSTRKEKREHPYAFDDTCPKCRNLRQSGPRKVASLNKHIENAARIFFCTDGCADHTRIGKKESWYRHENSSHWKVEKWRCNRWTSPARRSVCEFESNFSHAFKKHLRDNHPDFSCPRGRRSDDIGLFRISNEEFGVIFWCGFCRKYYRMSGSADERVQARLDHVEYHLKGRHGWDRGTVRTWTRKPEGEPLPHMVEPLDCRQSRALLAQRQRNRSHSALVEAPQQSSSSLADLPITSLTHDPAQPAAVAPQHLFIQQPQEPSMGTISNPRPRRSTTSLTCVSPRPPSPVYSFVDYMSSVIDFGDSEADDW